jgi:subtilisin-like proprotein convertase family protein
MRRITTILGCLALLTLAPAFEAVAQPSQLTLQGVLTSADGALISGAHDMTFAFYGAEDSEAPLFTTTVQGVEVTDGLYNEIVDFGNDAPGLNYAKVWLGITVGVQDEFPRVPLTSVMYAIRAQVAAKANSLDCNGCLTTGMLDFDPATQEELDAAPMPAGSCAENWFMTGIGDDGGLVCQGVPASVTSVDGLLGGTINGDVNIGGLLTVEGLEVCSNGGNCGDTLWQLQCDKDQVPVYSGELWGCGSSVTSIKPSDLPADGLNEVSNELLTNQFTDTFSSVTTPVDIKDFYPPGISDQIVVTDVGVAQDLTVSVNITNSDLSTVDVYLYDPEGTEFILYQKDGPGQELGATYPVPTEPVSGDLTSWIGKNPQGTWILKVVDSGFQDTENDGKINSWSIQVKTLSTKKVQVNGDLVVTGNITSAGGDGITIDNGGNVGVSGDLTVGGNLEGVAFKLDCTTVNASGGGNTASVQCPAGYAVTGGGCSTTPGPNGNVWNTYPDGNGWYCYESATSVSVYARCCRILVNQAQ